MEVLASCTADSTMGDDGASEHAGSVTRASPVSRKAWQRQPPKSSVRRSQLRQGSGIQSSPRNRWNEVDSCQIHFSEFSLTFSNDSPGKTSAAWQGSTLPDGLISINLRPQPPMQAFGYLA